jgi:hypothetical protein
MRWTVRILAALLAVWAGYVLSPYMAIYRIGQAVERRDVAELTERVDFPRLRVSLARQITTAYLDATGQSSALTPFARSFAAGLGGTLADPLVAQILTPQALADLLDGGRLPAGIEAPSLGGGIGSTSWREVWGILAGSEGRGFSRMVFSAPFDRPRDEQFRLELRISDFTWRLAGIELPKTLVRRLVQELPEPERAAS